MSKLRILTGAAITAAIIFPFTNCEKLPSTGNPWIEVRFESYNAPSIQALKFCPNRLRLKKTAVGLEEEVLDLSTTEITVSSLGTRLATLEIPEGTYERVELDLDNLCSSGQSAHLQNANGTFSTTDHITIRFDGTLVVEPDGAYLDLNLQSVISALTGITANSQIRPQAESAIGQY